MRPKERQYTTVYQSPQGGIHHAGDEKGLTGLWCDGQKNYAVGQGPHHDEKETTVFDAAKRWLDLYFTGKEPDFTPPLHLTGTPFQMCVWNLLLKIPYGTTTTYGRLAARTG